MGPSGSGKTTLMNLLSGRQRTSGLTYTGAGKERVVMEGQLSNGGVPVSPEYFRGKVAYVFQDNALRKTDTPRECLRFSAYLRLPPGTPAKEREACVEKVLAQLHLEKCADQVIGDALSKGISGGEAKRTAVGVELISRPKMLLLDEPLSGLDSYNALTLVQSLKSLVGFGVPVLFTLHQPSSEIFVELDDLLVLHEGEVFFQGPADRLTGHMESIGFPCPTNFNPADHAMCVIQREPPEVIQTLKDSWQSSDLHQGLIASFDRAEWSTAAAAQQSNGDVTSTDESGGGDLLKSDDGDRGPRRSGRKCFEALIQLIARDLRGVWRQSKSFVFMYVQAVLIALLYGWLFLSSAIKGEDPHYAPNCLEGERYDAGSCTRYFQVHFAVMGLLCVNTMLASMSWAIEVFQGERSCFLRESSGGYYQVIPFFLSKTLFEVPLVGINCFITLLGMYWLVGLRGNFFLLALELLVLALASSSMYFCVSAMASTREKAHALALMPQISQFIFSGILVPTTFIPLSLQWLKYICPLYYGLGLLASTEFNYLYDEKAACVEQFGSDWEANCPSVAVRRMSLEIHDVHEGDGVWPNLIMCFVMFIGFRALAALILWRKSRFVF
jgi:ABC-type multidrug transport system ATPase subunit